LLISSPPNENIVPRLRCPAWIDRNDLPRRDAGRKPIAGRFNDGDIFQPRRERSRRVGSYGFKIASLA